MNGKQAWLTIGINNTTNKVVLMGLSLSRAEAQENGDKRKDAEYPVEFWTVFLIDDILGEKIDCWLTRKGLPREERVDVIKKIGKQMLEMMQDEPA